MRKYNIDYYSTEETLTCDCRITDKLKFTAASSLNELIDNLDIFIRKIDLKVPPRRKDMVFFVKELRFYEVKEIDDAGDFYIVNISKLKRHE